MAEMIREKLLMLLYDEIPHGIAVVIDTLEERTSSNGIDILDIGAVIYCEKESHKGMIKVNLKTWVKVRDGWRNDENRIADFGLTSK